VGLSAQASQCSLTRRVALVLRCLAAALVAALAPAGLPRHNRLVALASRRRQLVAALVAATLASQHQAAALAPAGLPRHNRLVALASRRRQLVAALVARLPAVPEAVARESIHLQQRRPQRWNPLCSEWRTAARQPLVRARSCSTQHHPRPAIPTSPTWICSHFKHKPSDSARFHSSRHLSSFGRVCTARVHHNTLVYFMLAHIHTTNLQIYISLSLSLSLSRSLSRYAKIREDLEQELVRNHRHGR